MIAAIDLGRILSRYAIRSGWVFYPAAGLFLGYLLSMMIRKRRGERAGSLEDEPEL